MCAFCDDFENDDGDGVEYDIILPIQMMPPWNLLTLLMALLMVVLMLSMLLTVLLIFCRILNNNSQVVDQRMIG